MGAHVSHHPMFVLKSHDEQALYDAPFERATIRELKRFLGLRTGVWSHPSNPGLRKTYLINDTADEYRVINFKKLPIIVVRLECPYLGEEEPVRRRRRPHPRSKSDGVAMNRYWHRTDR